MIVTQDLSKKFGDFIAVDAVNLNIGKGEVLALLGPNGAGKTTTVRLLTSILRPSQGWAKVAGYDVVEEPQAVRSSVGVLTENHGEESCACWLCNQWIRQRRKTKTD